MMPDIYGGKKVTLKGVTIDETQEFYDTDNINIQTGVGSDNAPILTNVDNGGDLVFLTSDMGAIDGSFQFAGDVVDKAFTFAGDAGAAIQDIATKAITATTANTDKIIDNANNQITSAFTLAGNAFGQSLATISQEAAATRLFVGDVVGQSLDTIRESNENLFETSNELFGSFAAASLATQKQTTATIATVADKTRSEFAQGFTELQGTLSKVFIGIAVVIGGVVIFRSVNA